VFETVLVANRGEIAVRVLSTLRRMDIRGVAVYSDADATARHVAEADDAFRIGPGPARHSYLCVEAIVQAAVRSGADAVHPGYGFLSERAELARACETAGIVFIGPPPAVIVLMGDKIRAKAVAFEAGVPVVPGRAGPGLSDEDLMAAALEIGFPVLLKPSAGGGGKGMHQVTEEGSLRTAIATARREAQGAFGDDSLFVERWVDQARHVEIQVLADTHGGVVHLGERECSLQRRHQKIVEEAPSPALDEDTRQAMATHAVALAHHCGYVGAGTVEFVVPSAHPDTYFFLEMNTRLQVEHPVTELVTGLDLVELQVQVAAGQPLPFTQGEVRRHGHAVEARVYAEDPASGFLPTGGQVLAYREPDGPGIRVDSGLAVGTTVGTLYDPMLAKVVAWAPQREQALRRLQKALGETVILGLGTNVDFLRSLTGDPEVVAGQLHTGLVDRHAAQMLGAGTAPGGHLDPGIAGALVAAAVADASSAAVADPASAAVAGGSNGRRVPRGDRFALADGWRFGGPAWQERRYQVDGGDPVTLRVRAAGRVGAVPATWDVQICPSDVAPALAFEAIVPVPTVEHGVPTTAADRDSPVVVEGVVVAVQGSRLTVRRSDRTWHYAHARDGEIRWLGRAGTAWAVRAMTRYSPGTRAGVTARAGGVVRSPMPGSVVVVAVAPGDVVVAGDPLVVVEAMKMEHTVVAPIDGVVGPGVVSPGAQVALDAVLATVVPHGQRDPVAVEGGAGGGS